MCKVVVVGDVAVGKTSIVNRFVHSSFNRDYRATIGVDFEIEKISVLGVPFKLQMWDTAGQERFKCISSAYYRGANAIIAVFDVSDWEVSLDRASTWMSEALACQPSTGGGGGSTSTDAHGSATAGSNGSSGGVLRFLVANKSDLVSDRVVAVGADLWRMAVDVAKLHGAELWIVSAKTGENVTELFLRLGALGFDAALLAYLDGARNNCGPTALSPGSGQPHAPQIGSPTLHISANNNDTNNQQKTKSCCA